VIDAYIADVHTGLDACVQDRARAPLDRVRHFFELTQQSYEKDGYMGCLMGGLGQELSGVSEVFRAKIEWCFSSIADRLALCLEEAKQQGDIPASCDIRQVADLLVDCWEGAALRSRLRRNPASLTAMLDFCLRSVATPERRVISSR
jgi:TetR/AcrR family transcriptional regulator, transcriptional repressor for nem operon